MKHMAVAIGWNKIDSQVWGSGGELPDCEKDAEDLAYRWRGVDIPTTVLKTKEATRARCKGALHTAIEHMDENGLLIVSVSGHGSDKPDTSGDEQSGRDQYICAYDGPVTDDTIGEWFDSVTKPIKILFICDTCRSGSMGRGIVPVRFKRDVLTRGPAQMILMAGCSESGTSDSTGTGGRWTRSLCALSPRGKSPQLWFQAARMLCNASASQEPQWVEYGNVTADFRSGPLIER